MSYYFSNSTGGKLYNPTPFSSTFSFANGVTCGIWIRRPAGGTWPSYAIPSILSAYNNDWNDYVMHQFFDPEGVWRTLRGGPPSGGSDNGPDTINLGTGYGSTWVGFIIRHRPNTFSGNGGLLVGTKSQRTTNSLPSTSDPTSNLQYLGIGNYLSSNSNSPNGCYLAEYAAWNSYLHPDECELYLAGLSAKLISPTTLKAYYPLRNSATWHADESGVNNSPITIDIANGSPTWSEDHPQIYTNRPELTSTAAVKRFRPASAGRIRSIWIGR